MKAVRADAGVYCKDGKIGISTPYDEALVSEVKRTGEARWDADIKKWIFEPTYNGLNAILVVMDWTNEHKGWKWFVPESAKPFFAEVGLAIAEEVTC